MHGSDTWDQKDFTLVKDYQPIECTLDWTFSSPFKGTVSKLSPDLFDVELPQSLFAEIGQSSPKLTHTNAEDIPLDRLGVNNPILYYGQTTLYEDELGDKGFSKANVRFRVMKDSFFVLLRSYVRIDHVCVRIYDTRIYHEFGTNKLIRDFSHLEATYASLELEGFKFGGNCMLNENQSDEIYPYLPVLSRVKDMILLD